MTDGVIRSKFTLEGGELTHEAYQPTEKLILDRNAELRKNTGAIQDLGAQSEGGAFGRQVASVPEIMYTEAIREGFELNCPDADIAGKEMMRFLATEKGKMCLIREKI